MITGSIISIYQKLLIMQRMIFKIPIGGVSKSQAEKTLKKLIRDYSNNHWIPINVVRAGKIKKILNYINF